MFGHRPDGRRVKKLDPIVQITPYLMPMRCDAQVFLEHKADYEKLSRYIVRKSQEGEKITFMQILVAAYVRAVSNNPEVNRFIFNKQYYSRNNCSVSYTVLKLYGAEVPAGYRQQRNDRAHPLRPDGHDLRRAGPHE